MGNKYLLYIDILGFADLSYQNDKSIRKIYETIDELNVHNHDSFDTIVFSDTILVANKHAITDEHSHEYHVMYSCEFVQDFLYRCKCKNITAPFRAVLSYGEFEYYNLKNISCYHGKALIEGYKKEKEINGIGLFIHKSIAKYNKIFAMSEYDNDLNYVFLTQTLNCYYDLYKGETPVSNYVIEVGYDFWKLPTEIDIIKEYYTESIYNREPRVRAKYLQTYQLFKSKYPIIINKLESANFAYSVINADVNWEKQRYTIL